MTAPTTIYRSSEEVVFLSDHPNDDEDMWRLYELAKKNQWNVSDLSWQTPIDWEKGLFKNQLLDIYGESFWTKLDKKNQVEMNRLYTSWMCSRLLHGEHAAAIICGQLVGMVPGAESKMFLSTQTMDEARHTEFFARFVRDRAGTLYPVPQPFLDRNRRTIEDSRWYVKTISLQLAAEILAVEVFRMWHVNSADPVLAQGLEYIIRDESRHKAFGLIAIPQILPMIPKDEMKEIEDYTTFFLVKTYESFWAEDAYADMGFNPSERQAIKEIWRRRMVEREFGKETVQGIARAGLMTEKVASAAEAAGIPVRQWVV